ncbi:MAG: diacylglycerol O-acyltransferase [Ilumatobacter sp.]|jgi:diacylglycerol O-acyltransferase
MTEIEYDEWMSDNDALLWHIERDPLLRSTVTSVWLLDSTPEREQIDAVVHRMVSRLPRLRQRVIDDPNGIATPRWEDDPYFEVSYHYRWIRLPGSQPNIDDVLDYAQHSASRSFDKARPLWGIEVVEGLAEQRAALVMTVHHAIADGLGLVNMLQHMVEVGPDDAAADAAANAADEWVPAPSLVAATSGMRAAGRSVTRRVSQEAKTSMRLGRATMRSTAGFLRDPVGTARSAVRTTSSVAGIVKPTPRPLSPLITARSMTPVFKTLTVPLDQLKTAAQSGGATINDAFVSSVLDGLDRYHRSLGSDCDEIRMAMPISLRTSESAGLASNQFVPARVQLPLGQLPAADRLADTRMRLLAVRDEPALPHISDISAMIGRLGPAASVAIVGGMMKGVDITTSNVPGPPFPVWIGHARVGEFFAFGPLAGAAINITLFSYDGVVHLGINLDAKAITDPLLFVECLRLGLDATLELPDRAR